jgi:hypothetical protein
MLSFSRFKLIPSLISTFPSLFSSFPFSSSTLLLSSECPHYPPSPPLPTAQVLYPPLTYLKPTGRTDSVLIKRDDHQLSFTVIEVAPSIS